MRGRILNIKKSTWLMISLLLNLFIFGGLSLYSILAFRYFDNVFFIFCITTGAHQIIKSALFKFDSSCYFGVLLLLIGGFYFVVNYFQIEWLYSVFVLFSFAFASFTVAIFYRQPFQIFLSFSLYFIALGLLLFVLKAVSVWIFVAIVVSSVLLLIVRFVTL